MRRLIHLAILIALTTVLTGTPVAQTTHDREVCFTAVRGDGSPVAEISPSDLQLPKGLRVSKIEKVSSAPVHFALLLDNSGSRRRSLDVQKEIGKALLEELLRNGKDKALVVNFNDEHYLDQDLTNNLAALTKAIERGSARGASALSDTVSFTAEHLGENPSYPPGAKVILLFTDGDDNASHLRGVRAVNMLQSNAVRVYSFRFGEGDRHGNALLRDLVTASSGRTFELPIRKCFTLEKELAAIRSDLENCFRMTYSYPERKSFQIESSTRDLVIKSPKIKN